MVLHGSVFCTRSVSSMVSNPAQATVTQLADDSAFGGVCSQSDQSGTYYNISPRGSVESNIKTLTGLASSVFKTEFKTELKRPI